MPPHYVLHQFRPTETIDAVIKLRGRHNFTPEEVRVMRERFNELNGPRVPRTGEIFKIPVEPLTVDDYGNLVNVMAPVDPFLVDIPIIPDPCKDREQPPEREHPGDPREPVHKFPPEPIPGPHPQQAPKEYGDEQVTPDPGEKPGQNIEKSSIQGPILSVSGQRRPKG